MSPPRRARPRRKAKKREPSQFCPDPRQLDLVDYVNRKAKSEAFAKLDEAIAEAIRKDGWT